MKKVKDITQDSEYNYMSEKNDVFAELANVNANDVTNNIGLSLINGITNDEWYDYIYTVRAGTLNHKVSFYIDVMYRLHRGDGRLSCGESCGVMAILKNGEVIRLDDLAVLPESFSKVLTSDKVMYSSSIFLA